MFRTLINNLSRNQKIGILIILQIIVIIILVLIVQAFTVEKSHVEINNEPEYSGEIPKEAEKFIGDNVWQIVKSKVVGADRNDVDMTIREGTYKETFTDDGVQVEFIADIDSLKQSYIINTGWSNDEKTIYEVIVNCPPQDQMKYEDAICYGAYNSTYSLDLYLPYIVYPEGYGDDEVVAPNYMITGDENTKTLEIMVSMCNVEKYKKAAWDYLNTLPIDFSSYTIEYRVNDVDVRC